MVCRLNQTARSTVLWTIILVAQYSDQHIWTSVLSFQHSKSLDTKRSWAPSYFWFQSSAILLGRFLVVGGPPPGLGWSIVFNQHRNVTASAEQSRIPRRQYQGWNGFDMVLTSISSIYRCFMTMVGMSVRVLKPCVQYTMCCRFFSVGDFEGISCVMYDRRGCVFLYVLS